MQDFEVRERFNTAIWILLAAVLTIGIAWVSNDYLSLMDRLGTNIPQNDMMRDYSIAVIWALLIGLSIPLWVSEPRDTVMVGLGWIAKSVVTLGIMPFVESVYDLDAFMYFAEGTSDQLEWEGFTLSSGTHNAGTHNTIQLVWLHNRIIPDSYHSAKVMWSFVSLLGSYLIYRGVTIYLNRADRRVFYLVTLTPSILYWSSILGKDPISYFAMGLYIYGTIAWYRRSNPKYLVLVGVAITIATLIRAWYAPLLVTPYVAFVLTSSKTASIGPVNFLVRIGLAGVLGVGAIASLALTRFGSSIQSADNFLETTNTIRGNFATGGSAIEAEAHSNLASLLLSLPYGMFTALFRPLPGEVMNAFGLLSGIEGMLILGLVLLAVLRLRLRHLRDPIVLWGLLFVLLWSAMYGLTASTNLGTIVRYRLQALPYVLCLAAYLVSRYASPQEDNDKRE